MLGGRGECGHPAETGNILGSQVLAPEWGCSLLRPPQEARETAPPHTSVARGWIILASLPL